MARITFSLQYIVIDMVVAWRETILSHKALMQLSAIEHRRLADEQYIRNHYWSVLFVWGCDMWWAGEDSWCGRYLSYCLLPSEWSFKRTLMFIVPANVTRTSCATCQPWAHSMPPPNSRILKSAKPPWDPLVDEGPFSSRNIKMTLRAGSFFSWGVPLGAKGPWDPHSHCKGWSATTL